jgi:hypothetical protein
MYVIMMGYPQSAFISVSAAACGEVFLATQGSHGFGDPVVEIVALPISIGLPQEFFHRKFTTIWCS